MLKSKIRQTLNHVHKLAISKKFTIFGAESCTGGLISQLLTKKAGSSAYFLGSVISYANEIKSKILLVSEEIIQNHGAVSAETVYAMLEGAYALSHADFVYAVSGIAGPGGGTKAKPVGTVILGFKFGKNSIVINCQIDGSRENIRNQTAYKVLHYLGRFIESENKKALTVSA